MTRRYRAAVADQPAQEIVAPGAATVEPATERYRRQVGPEATERPSPQLAGAVGGLAAFLGVPAIAALVPEIVEGSASRSVGFAAFAAFGAGGVALLLAGAPSQRTAGVVALAAAVPMAVGFLILSDGNFSTSEPTTVLALSTVTWGILHLAGPGRGHAVFLAAAIAGTWATIVVQTGLDAVTAINPISPFGPPEFFGPEPDTTVPALVSLVFGAGYLLAAFALDRAGLRGTATAFLGVGIAAVILGVVLAGSGRDEIVVGLLLLSAGALVGFVGGRLGRRFSTWLGALGAVSGLATVVVALFDGDAVAAGSLTLLAVAAAIVVAVPLLARALGEPATPEDPSPPVPPEPPSPEPAPEPAPAPRPRSRRSSQTSPKPSESGARRAPTTRQPRKRPQS